MHSAEEVASWSPPPVRKGYMTVPRLPVDNVPDERDMVIRDIEGRLPDGLRGTLYRNGPGTYRSGGLMLDHPFDGDGMISMFAIADGQVRVSNRFVRTPNYLAGLRGRGQRYRGIGRQRPGGMIANALRVPVNVANTSVAFHAGELLALWEGGKPYAVDPDSLDTLGLHDFDGKLGGLAWLGSFSAHPKTDPHTGIMYNFGVEGFPLPHLRCYSVDRRGRMDHVASVRLPRISVVHDFALTEKHLVFIIDPLEVKLLRIGLGIGSVFDNVHYRSDLATQFILVPRDGSKPTIIEHTALMHFHINNAFEDGDDTVMDIIEYDDAKILYLTSNFLHGVEQPNYTNALQRYRINPSGKVWREEQCPWAGEFPNHDKRRTTQKNRYTYYSGVPQRETSSGFGRAIIKVDHETGRYTVQDRGPAEMLCEPVFVPRSADSAEDEGWLLTAVYLPAEDRSNLLVLDARDVEADPVATVRLPDYMPPGYHGIFTNRLATLPQDR